MQIENKTLDEYFQKKYGNIEKSKKFDTFEFTKQFNQKKRELVEKLNKEKLNQQELETVKTELNILQEYVTKNSNFLSKYEIQKCTSLLKEYRFKIDSFSQKNTKFSFSKRNKVASSKKETSLKKSEMPKEEEQENLSNKKEFKNILDQKITLTHDELSFDEDFTVKDSKNSTITIETIVGAIYFRNLQNCHVYCAPVTGSTFVQNCSNCHFELASKQLRIHETENCEFKIFCRNTSVIEKSKNLKFGEYSFNYPNKIKDFQKVEFFENNWKNIQDFDQPTKKKSTNWDFL
eukprot:gene9615-1819_t